MTTELTAETKARVIAICLSEVNAEAHSIVEDAWGLVHRLDAFLSTHAPDVGADILRKAGLPIPTDPDARCGADTFREFVASAVGFRWCLYQFAGEAGSEIPGIEGAARLLRESTDALPAAEPAAA